MSIVYKGLRNGGWSQGDDGRVTSSRSMVFFFNAGESAAKVAQEANIPAIGSAHPDDASLLLNSVTISDPQEGDGIKSGKYEVALNYARQASGLQNGQQDQDLEPWNRRPYDISIGPKEVVQAFVKAYDAGDGNGLPSVPVLNPAGDPYEDSTATQNIVLRFSYNLQDASPYWPGRYCDTINAVDMQVCDVGIGARRGLMRAISLSPHREYGPDGELLYSYTRMDIEIEISNKPWQREILARGLYFLSGGKKIRIYASKSGATYGAAADCGEDPIPVDEPQKLAADGSLLALGDDPVYQTFQDKYAANWKELGMPSTAE